jgi:Fe-S-cluster-containing hydrogenase component 2
MKKLFIDYDKCLQCDKCTVKCSYYMHRENAGVTSLREQISFMFACRKCEDYPCVNACPNGALRREDNLIKRSNFICTSCKSCALACPFGTILPEIIPYIVSRCDYCLKRLKENEMPECVKGCKLDALKYIEEEELQGRENIHKFGDFILVKAVSWLEKYGIKK